MDLLRIVTAGSVDDGKSTLIGRLLFETRSLKEDQLEHILEKSKAKGYDYTDFYLATYGLLTQREQGITIDVSHIYFSYKQRRFIIADAPGHIEYTRNMITGASNSNVDIVLIDARKGVIEQTKRHFYITRLLGIETIIFAINKMDLIDYKADQYNKIVGAIQRLIKNLGHPPSSIHFIPISALQGDNLIQPSLKTPYYKGAPLLDVLNRLTIETSQQQESLFQFQYVLRPHRETYHDYRGFAGKVNSGSFRVNERIEVFHSGHQARIKSIEKYGIPKNQIVEGENATILLDQEIDLSRGNTLIGQKRPVRAVKQLQATLSWMQNDPLVIGKKYWLQQGVDRVQSKIKHIKGKIELSSGKLGPTDSLKLNDLGKVDILLANPILGLPFKTNNRLGAFILIDAMTNNTAGIGFIE